MRLVVISGDPIPRGKEDDARFCEENSRLSTWG